MNDQISLSDVMAQLQALQARNAALEAKLAQTAAVGRRVTFKVTEKGAVSVYGLGQWPTTLYVSQWDAFLPHIDDLKAFIETNRAVLAVKAPNK